MRRMTRRQLPFVTATTPTMEADVTAARRLTSASLDRQVDVQSEQALTVANVEVTGSDTPFNQIGNNNISFQIAIESNVDDAFKPIPSTQNSIAGPFAVQFRFNIPTHIQLTTIQFRDGDGDNIVQSGIETYIGKLPAKTTEDVIIEFNITDTAQPGSKNISVYIDPLSVDEQG